MTTVTSPVPARLETARLETVMVAMPDGVELATDVWLPTEGCGPWPTLVQRLPYGRGAASAMVLPTPAALTRLGYAVVVQDVRGTGDSHGSFVPFANADDGAVTVEWAASQPFSTGSVCMYGFSYQGYHQLQVAAMKPAGLVGIAPMMCPSSPYEFVYEDGCRKWDFMALWGAQLARLGRDPLPRSGDVNATPAEAIGSEPPAWWSDWVTHDRYDDYWAGFTADLTQIDVPVFTVLGYADVFAKGTWNLVEQINATVVCGPWEHMPWGTSIGGLELGPSAGPQPAVEGFLAFLSAVFADTEVAPSTTWFEIGGGWESSTLWPPTAETVTLHGSSDIRHANSRHGDGRLSAQSTPEYDLVDDFIADPTALVRGTSDGLPLVAGVQDRRDVLCYTTAPALEPVRVIGASFVELQVSAPVASLDVVAALSLVTATEVRQVAMGAVRLSAETGAETTGITEQVAIELTPIGLVVAPGQALRVDISTSRFPRYDINPQGADQIKIAAVTVTDLTVKLPLIGCSPDTKEI